VKLILYSLVLFVLTACSNEEQRFVCVNEKLTTSEGLIIKNDELSFGLISKMKLCNKVGTKNIYKEDCSTKGKYVSFTFDIVSYDLEKVVPASSKSKYNYNFTFYKCVKK
jgi:hypothetical protein